jgi:hypothetical protein
MALTAKLYQIGRRKANGLMNKWNGGWINRSTPPIQSSSLGRRTKFFGRSAGLHPAVSRIFNPQSFGQTQRR